VRNRLTVAAAYVGAVVGAGFGSGREIAHFFARHGAPGLWGAGWAAALFALVGAVVLLAGLPTQGGRPVDLYTRLCGPLLGGAIRLSSLLFLWVSLAVVDAAGAALLHGRLPPALAGALWAGAFTVMAGLGPRGQLRSNLLLVPVIVLFVLAAALYAHHGGGGPGPSARPGALPAALAGSTLYVAYNTVLVVSTLGATAVLVPSPPQAVFSGLLGGAAVGLLCMLATWALLPSASTGPLPTLPLAGVFPPGSSWARLYPLCMSAALWTTGTAVLVSWHGRGIRGPALALLAGSAFLPSLAGLALLVDRVYPLLGYTGLPLLVAILWHGVRGVLCSSHGV